MTQDYQNKEELATLAAKLEKNNTQKKALIGYDGFVDEIIEVVDKRQDAENYDRVLTLADYGARISAAAGLSANVELVTVQTKLGGNGPIMANSLMNQDQGIFYIGCIGKNGIHEVFHDFVSKCEKVISFEEPGHTDALEFMDGKLMMGKIEHLKYVNWQNLLAASSREELVEIVSQSSLLSFNNWTMLTGMNSIMDGILSIIKEVPNKPAIFIDLADPQKRLDEDIKEALNQLKEYAQETDVILSMNKNESMIVADLLGVSRDDVTQRAVKIRESLDVAHVVIHPLHGAAAATKDWAGYVVGPYTDKPKLTTGAGDNFNAGYCNGVLRGFSAEECLMLGVNTSGYYVRNAASPNKEQLVAFLKSNNS